MAFTYVAAGGLRIKGCADVGLSKRYAVKFAVNGTAYVCDKASLHGVIQPVIIKKIYIHEYARYGFQVTYQDNTNRIWLQEELCNAQEASSLATAYLEYQIAKASEVACES